jgi:hypothetical protein
VFKPYAPKGYVDLTAEPLKPDLPWNRIMSDRPSDALQPSTKRRAGVQGGKDDDDEEDEAGDPGNWQPDPDVIAKRRKVRARRADEAAPVAMSTSTASANPFAGITIAPSAPATSNPFASISLVAPAPTTAPATATKVPKYFEFHLWPFSNPFPFIHLQAAESAGGPLATSQMPTPESSKDPEPKVGSRPTTSSCPPPIVSMAESTIPLPIRTTRLSPQGVPQQDLVSTHPPTRLLP